MQRLPILEMSPRSEQQRTHEPRRSDRTSNSARRYSPVRIKTTDIARYVRSYWSDPSFGQTSPNDGIVEAIYPPYGTEDPKSMATIIRPLHSTKIRYLKHDTSESVSSSGNTR